MCVCGPFTALISFPTFLAMNEVQWPLSLNLNPLQLSDPRDAFDHYIKPHLNKYVPDLKGILVHVNKQSVEIHPSPDLATPRDNGSQCIIRLLPEYPFAKVCDF